MIVVVLKRCIRCREEKPTAEFHVDRCACDGLQAYCKTCKIQQVEDRRTRLRATNAWRGVAEKRCATCLLVKPAKRFYLSTGELDGLSYKCRACTRQYARARRSRIVAAGPIHISQKQCRKCERVLEREAFAKDVGAVDGLLQQCRQCHAIAQASVQYAIPFEEAARLRQREKCDICQSTLTAGNRNIDHCHATGYVRGVLCRGCNSMLGMARDRPDVLEKGAEYLRDSVAKAKNTGIAVTAGPLVVH